MLNLLRSVEEIFDLEIVTLRIVKKGKEIYASFGLKLQKLWLQYYCDKCLVKVEKALNLWMEDMTSS